MYVPDGVVLEDYVWDRSELVVIQGPIGSGTSTASCHRINILAQEQEPDFDGVRRTRWLIIRKSYRQLKKTTVKTWLEWFPEHEFGPMARSEPMTHHLRYQHPSGDGTSVDCEVIFLSIDSPETAEEEAASFEITGFWYNEAQFAEKEVIDELLSRCGRYPSQRNGPGATWYGGMLDLNAPIEGHWIPYMRGDISLPVDWSPAEKAAMQKPETWRFLVQPPGLIEVVRDGEIKYQPNPAAENQKNLKKTYMEQIRGKKPEWINQRVMNRIGLYLGGQPVYPTYAPSVHDHSRDMEPVEGFPIIVGLDFGREPAAIFMQDVNGQWTALSELVDYATSASQFAPRVARHLAQRYPGFRFDAYGDPRGGDGNQATETTAYDIFAHNGIRVFPATNDNSPEMRRSTVEAVLIRRNGLKINPACLILRQGLAGGYYFRKVKGHAGMVAPKPVKTPSSHIVEAMENALIGGGEGDAIVRSSNHQRLAPSPVFHPKSRLRQANDLRVPQNKFRERHNRFHR